jgi:hypothetical protein
MAFGTVVQYLFDRLIWLSQFENTRNIHPATELEDVGD